MVGIFFKLLARRRDRPWHPWCHYKMRRGGLYEETNVNYASRGRRRRWAKGRKSTISCKRRNKKILDNGSTKQSSTILARGLEIQLNNTTLGRSYVRLRKSSESHYMELYVRSVIRAYCKSDKAPLYYRDKTIARCTISFCLQPGIINVLALGSER